MRNGLVLISILAIGFLVSGCERETAVQPQDTSVAQGALDPELIAGQLVARAGWPIEEGRDLPAVEGELHRHFGFEREVLTGDIVRYRFEIPVGPGEFDVVGLHRVVREQRPYKPIRAEESIFMLHGSRSSFDQAYLKSSVPIDRTASVYFASQDIDVWGIDMAWSLVPEETSDFTFMADWGMDREVDHLTVAVAVARFSRLLTGNGLGQMNFMGWSLGAAEAYALAARESQLCPELRQVKGIIPVDIDVVTDDEGIREARCEEAAGTRGDLDAGIYHETTGVRMHLYADLARSAPDDPSPIFGWLTNYEAVLLIGTSTWLFGANTPAFHHTGGDFGESGFPLNPEGLLHTSPDAWIEYLATAAPYMPLLVKYEEKAAVCGETDVAWDDHLGDISIPVFYVGAAGGFGEYGIYTTTQLASDDVTTHIVSVQPPEDITLDIGHVDLFLANDAVELVYQPILNWMMDRAD